MKNLILALGQLDGTCGSGETYLDQMECLAAKAASSGAHLILFPELSSIGYFNSREVLDQLTEADDAVFLQWVTGLSKRLGIGICAGYVEHSEGRRYNTSVLTGRDGKLLGSARKVHLWKSEKRRFSEGTDYPVFDTEFGKIAILICYDLEFPEPARIAALKGAELLLCPAAWSRPAEGRWKIDLAAASLFNLCFTAGANYSDRLCCGLSAVYGPNGEPLAVIREEGEGLILAEIDYGAVRAQREKIPYFQDFRTKDVELLSKAAEERLRAGEEC